MNCCHRFLQGPETDPTTVRKIRDAIDNNKDVTVQLINYTKTGTFGLLCIYFALLLITHTLVFFIYTCLSVCSFLWFILVIIFHFSLHSGKKFWNLFHLQPMRDQKVHYHQSQAESSCWICILIWNFYFVGPGRGSVFHWGTTRWK